MPGVPVTMICLDGRSGTRVGTVAPGADDEGPGTMDEGMDAGIAEGVGETDGGRVEEFESGDEADEGEALRKLVL